MKLRSLVISIAILSLLVGCIPLTPSTTEETPIPTSSQASTQTATPVSTKTSIPSTSIPATFTITPTFDVSTIVTVTPGQAAVCPKVDITLQPNFDLPEKFNPKELFIYGLDKKVLDFLNQGGDYHKIITEIQNYYVMMHSDLPYPLLQDLTGDAVPEIIIRDEYIFSVIHIFSCIQGEYVDFVPLGPDESGWPVSLYAIDDLNADNLPEVLLKSAGRIAIYEWDGKDFRILNSDMGALGGVEYEFRDIGNDGVKEVMVKLTAPVVRFLEIPWRSSTTTYVWNGDVYSIQSTVFVPPTYRFQAIQDADREMLSQHFDKALSLYQDAIFSDKLEWWSPQRRSYQIDFEIKTANVSILGTPQPTMVPPTLPSPDMTEYPRLVAYSYYRIMLLYILQSHETDASIVYSTLQQKFPAGNPGFPYTEMATSFWDEYQSSQNMSSACKLAIQYATDHPEILVPLGSDYHGTQSHTYTPEDVCPFR